MPDSSRQRHGSESRTTVDLASRQYGDPARAAPPTRPGSHVAERDVVFSAPARRSFVTGWRRTPTSPGRTLLSNSHPAAAAITAGWTLLVNARALDCCPPFQQRMPLPSTEPYPRRDNERARPGDWEAPPSVSLAGRLRRAQLSMTNTPRGELGKLSQGCPSQPPQRQLCSPSCPRHF